MSTATAQFTLTRSFATTTERLWHLLTDPKMREAWGAPSDEDVLVVDRSDLRVGGEDLHRCGPADAPDYTVVTRWYHLEQPGAACFTETVEAGGMHIATSLVTYDIAATAEGAALTVTVTTASFVGAEALADFKTGWTAALDRLPRFIEAHA